MWCGVECHESFERLGQGLWEDYLLGWPGLGRGKVAEYWWRFRGIEAMAMGWMERSRVYSYKTHALASRRI